MKKAKKKSKVEIVFHLIKKMSQSDKRYFKLNNQTYKTNKDFLKLFDYLNTREKLEHSALDAFFEKKNITNPDSCIAYLQSKVIDSLKGEARKTFAKLYNENIEQHIEACSVYLYADFHELALKEIQKAEKIALRLENYNYLIRIYIIRRDILKKVHFTHDSYENLRKDVVRKLEWALNQSLLINKVHEATRAMFFYIKPDSSEYREIFNKIEEFAVRMEELPFACKISILKAKVHDAYLNRESLKALDLLEQTVELWESISYGRWSLSEYMVTWNNLLVLSTAPDMPSSKVKGYFNIYLELPKKHSTVFSTSPEMFRKSYFIIRHSVETLIVLEYREYERIDELEQDLLKGLTTFWDLTAWTDILQLMFLRMGLIHLILGNPERTDYWISRYNKIPKPTNPLWDDTREILTVLVDYDRGNYVYLQSKMRSLKRKWQKEKSQSPNVIVMFGMIQKALLKPNQNKIPEIWKSGLEEIYQAEKTRSSFIIRLSRWVETKIKPEFIESTISEK